MDLGVHLPLMEFGDEGQSPGRLRAAVDAARDNGFAAISSNDHFLFSTPWLDGPTALAAAIERSGEMELATTISLVAHRGPVPLAKTLAALDILSGGRVTAGVGPGSSERDYDAIGIPFDDRWKRFDEAVAILRGCSAARRGRTRRASTRCPTPSWRRRPSRRAASRCGSEAGGRRLGSAASRASRTAGSPRPTTRPPRDLSRGVELLTDELARQGRRANGFPNALVTMWTWVTEDRAERDRVLRDVLAPLLKRDPEVLGDQVCVGSAEECAELLSKFAAAGCERVYMWPLGDEPRQLELVATEVAPKITH